MGANSKAWEQGYRQGKDGRGDSRCPYPENTLQYKDWMNGLMHGQSEAREKYSTQNSFQNGRARATAFLNRKMEAAGVKA